MRQFHSHHRSTFRLFQSYQQSVRCASFCRAFFNLCKDSTKPASFSQRTAFTKSFASAFQNIRSPTSLLSGNRGLAQGAAKGDISAAEWPSPTRSARQLMAQGALSAILFGESICSALGVSGGAGLCSASSGMGSAFAMSLLMQAGGTSSFIRTLFHECGGAAIPMELILKKLTGVLLVDCRCAL